MMIISTPIARAALGLLLCLGGAGTSPGQTPAERLRLTGYSDRWSVRAGDAVRFMVSSDLPRYRVQIVRLIHGDDNTRGPGFKAEEVAGSANGEYPGRPQPLRGGSYVLVPDDPELRTTGSFTVSAWIAPSAPGPGSQALVTKWSEPPRRGFGLFLHPTRGLELRLAGAEGRVHTVRSERPIPRWIAASVYNTLGFTPGRNANTTSWTFVAATYDASTGRVALYQQSDHRWSSDSPTVVERITPLRRLATSSAPLLVAAFWEWWEDGDQRVGGHFNGKIDSPTLYDRALTPAEISRLREGEHPGGPVAAWDFSREMDTRTIRDISGHEHHGRTVNTPTRAVTGHTWTGRVLRHLDAPEQYGAVFFHEDDLDDAGWDVGFEWTVPASFRSGVYAARLRAGNQEDFIPFFVRPAPGAATAPIAYLIPTYSYLAYSGFTLGLPNLLSLYDLHRDQTGVTFASRLKPMLEVRPNWTRSRHFVADLFLIDWMEAKGFTYDVITDEDLHHEGRDLLAPYRTVMTGSHPEYWTEAMLDGLDAYLRSGGRLMYLGGNGFYWVISPDAKRPEVIELRRWGGTMAWAAAPGEYYHSTTGELGGLWRFRGRPPQALVGVGFAAQGGAAGPGYHRQPGSFDPRAAFIFDGIGPNEVIGDFPSLALPSGAAGDEVDRLDFALGTPPHTLLLATATGFSDEYQHVIEENNLSDSRQGGPVNEFVRADMVYFETPNGGGVFSASSIAWMGTLSYNDYENNVSRITENVLRRFASDEPLPAPRR